MAARSSIAARLAAWLLGIAALCLLLWIWDAVLFAGLRLAPAGLVQEWWGVAAYWLGLGGVQIPLLGLAALAAWQWAKRPDLTGIALIALAAVVASGLITQLVKHLAGRPRPRMNLAWWEMAGPALDSDLHSMPSGHAATSFALAMYLGLKFPRWAMLLLITAALISAGRVMSLSHYPSDVVAGAWLGLGVGWLAEFLQRKREKNGVA